MLFRVYVVSGLGFILQLQEPQAQLVQARLTVLQSTDQDMCGRQTRPWKAEVAALPAGASTVVDIDPALP